MGKSKAICGLLKKFSSEDMFIDFREERRKKRGELEVGGERERERNINVREKYLSVASLSGSFIAAPVCHG